MVATVKKTISLSAELAKEAEDMARAEGKTLSAIVQDALRHARKIRILPDEPDNRLFECAFESKGNAIVTGNHAMLKLQEHGEIQILSLNECLSQP